MKDWDAGAKYLQILSWLPEIWITSREVAVWERGLDSTIWKENDCLSKKKVQRLE